MKKVKSETKDEIIVEEASEEATEKTFEVKEGEKLVEESPQAIKANRKSILEEAKAKLKAGIVMSNLSLKEQIEIKRSE